MSEVTIFVMHFLNTPALGPNVKNEHDAHVTFLAHVICVKKPSYDELLREVERISSKTPEFLIQFGNLQYFGPDKDKPVVQIVKTSEGAQLHEDLVQAAHVMGLTLGQPQYAGVNFSPHVSLPQDGKTPVGPIVIDTITVVVNQNDSDLTEVIGNFNLSG